MEGAPHRLGSVLRGGSTLHNLLGICLCAVVTADCSYDIGKLRAPSVHVRDAATDPPGAADGAFVAEIGVQPDSDRDTTATRMEVLPDLGVSIDIPAPADAPPAADLISAREVSVSDEGEGLAEVAEAIDLAVSDDVDAPLSPAVDGGDAGGAGGTGGGTGGGGTGGGGTGGSDTDGGGTGGSGTGGAGTGGGGVGGSGTGGASIDGGGTGGAGPDPDLVLWYKFDESSGTLAADSAVFGGVARNATLATIGTGASAVFSTTKQVGSHAVSLTPATLSPNANGAYVIVPSLSALAPAAITIAVWVNLRANTATQTWERIFDYGNSPTGMNWLNLMARSGDAASGPVEFAMSNIGHDQTQALIGSDPLTANVWHHIAIVLKAGTTYTGTMYIDREPVATNSAMTLHMADIGATTNNWLGRSQFSSDPCFNGLLDDFRVYKRALSPQEIADLFALR